MFKSKCTLLYIFFFFFNDTATTEIYTLSLHDALPIYGTTQFTITDTDTSHYPSFVPNGRSVTVTEPNGSRDRKSTRLNSSHSQISYAVFCLKKKKCHKSAPCLLTRLFSDYDFTDIHSA